MSVRDLIFFLVFNGNSLNRFYETFSLHLYSDISRSIKVLSPYLRIVVNPNRPNEYLKPSKVSCKVFICYFNNFISLNFNVFISHYAVLYGCSYSNELQFYLF